MAHAGRSTGPRNLGVSGTQYAFGIQVYPLIWQLTTRLTGWQWSAAELPVRVNALVMHFYLTTLQIHCRLAL